MLTPQTVPQLDFNLKIPLDLICIVQNHFLKKITRSRSLEYFRPQNGHLLKFLPNKKAATIDRNWRRTKMLEKKSVRLLPLLLPLFAGWKCFTKIRLSPGEKEPRHWLIVPAARGLRRHTYWPYLTITRRNMPIVSAEMRNVEKCLGETAISSSFPKNQ